MVMVNLDLATLVAIFPSRIVELFRHYILDEVALGLELVFFIIARMYDAELPLW
jgi:hypothetical protein